MLFAERNNAFVFACRTLKNLEYIEKAKQLNADEGVHPITQLGNSLLGLVVFPMARLVDERFKEILLSDLWGNGWPKIHITLDVDNQTSTHRRRRKPWQPTATLHDVVRHLRNAAAHGRVTFSSDSQRLEEVKITIEDRPQDGGPVNWRAYMTGEELREFCVKFSELLVDTLG